MDNAGGHGTNKTKQEYTRILKDEFNVQVEFQVANSPELNMLNLGAWMAIQSEVEEIHKNCTMQHDFLSSSIHTAFENLDESILTRIYNCWVKVLKIIIKSAGDNQQVDKFCGDAEVIDLTGDDFQHSSTYIQAILEYNESTDEEVEEVEEGLDGDADEIDVEDD